MRQSSGVRKEQPADAAAEDVRTEDTSTTGEDAGTGTVPPPRTGGSGRRGEPDPEPKARRRFWRIARWAALALALVILGVGAAGWFYYQHLNDNIKKNKLNLGDKQLDRSAANADGQRPLNILLLGSDSRGSKENQELGGARDDADRPPLADVQMLVHVSADRSNMSVISVPRDTRVTIPKCTDPESGKVYKATDRQIINTSLMNGGPGCTVATWEELTGIPIDHFMMIDFAGVVNMADAVGGVPVCVDANVYDDKSGLRLTKGTHTVKGVQALQWLRTRHGFEDGSDIGRTHAQHMYMNAMVRQLKGGTKLSDPGQLTDLAEAATKALTVDKDLGSVKKLYDLADDIKRVPSGRITMTTMPWVSDPRNPDAHVIPKPGDADKLFSLVRNDIALDGKDPRKDAKSTASAPPASAPKNIPVTVFNGTGTAVEPPATGRGSDIAAFLVKQGFAKATSDSTPRAQADTTITYPRATQRNDALAVAKALGLPDSAVRHSPEVQQITLVIGGDWRTGTTYPKSALEDGDADPTGSPSASATASPSPSAGAKDGKKKADENKAPESSDPLNGDDKSACMKVNSLNRF
ncbi:transcriptional regulator [Streptomyces mashuensis]|uniref:Transcriptional regulator n=1 Tax=Streptomyces mashuensis TaxID=33904 RepID=A0A919BA02_9ACTN|nr:LCP family protein [Streptomyces mashuensis]GHF74516.1 transcriptional regulator [Streptomyces mashuensis]